MKHGSWVFWVMIFCANSFSQTSISAVEERLSNREELFSSSVFLWNVEVKDKNYLSTVPVAAKGTQEYEKQLKTALSTPAKNPDTIQYKTSLKIGSNGTKVFVEERWFTRNSARNRPANENQAALLQQSSLTQYQDGVGIESVMLEDQNGQQLEKPMIVWKGYNDCFRSLHPRNPLLRAELFSFLSVKNPLRMYNCDWTMVEEDENYIKLACQSPSQLSSYSNLFLWLSVKHDYAPWRFEYVSGSNAYPSLVWQTKQFRNLNHQWVPHVVEYKSQIGHQPKINEKSMTFRLEKCDFQTSTTTPVFAKGTRVSDYRLMSQSLQPDDYIANVEQAVHYEWDGFLLSESELRKIALKQGRLPPQSGGFNLSWWLLFSPGILIILIGGYYYLKIRT